MTLYAEGLTWGEGPRWHEGALWSSDPQRGGIWTNRSGEWQFTPLASPSNGLWFLPDGRLVGAVIHQRRVGLWNGRHFGTYADLSDVAVGPLGDMVGDAKGGLYIDDVGFAADRGEAPRPGQIIYISSDGVATVAATEVEFPNGLALINDGKMLVVAETWKQRLIAYSVQPDGGLTDRRVYADLRAVASDEARPDGICTDLTGAGVWVCTLTAKTVVQVTESRVERTIDVAPGYPVACTTDQNSRMFVTIADSGGAPIMKAIAEKSVSCRVEVFDL